MVNTDNSFRAVKFSPNTIRLCQHNDCSNTGVINYYKHLTYMYSAKTNTGHPLPLISRLGVQ